MNLDVRSLRTFSRLAHSDVEKAAGSLIMFAGIDAYANVTKVELRAKPDVENEFAERDLVDVHIGFSGDLGGHTVLAFSPESAERLVDALMPGIDAIDADGELAESGLKEAANITLGGFIDGWTDCLDTTVDIMTPTYVSDENDGPLDRADVGGFENGDDNEHVLVFRNQLEAADSAIEFDLYVVPTTPSIGTIVEVSGDDGALPVESLAAFSEMTNDGVTQASEDITAMMGIDTTVEVSRSSLVPIEDVSMSLTDAVRRGVVLEFGGTLSGYITILLDEPSTENIASSPLPDMEGDEAMRQNVIQEIGNITTSGFLDGWANALETIIDISPPKHVHDIGSAIIDPLATDLAQSQEYAFLINSTIRTDDDEFICDIYVLPDETELREALKQLSPAARPLRGGISIQVYTTDTPAARSGRIKVGIADFAVSSDESMLTTSGLGSCIGVVLYDLEAGVSGLAHAMLPEADDGSESAKSVNTGVELLIAGMQAVGADTDRIVAKVAEGSTTFDFTSADDDGSIGGRDAVVTRTTLDGFGIDVIAGDVGGSHGRSLELGSETGGLRARSAKNGTHVL